MKLLVLGGSYFLGRVFTMSAVKEHELTLFNRGTYSMEEYGVRQIKGDRQKEEDLQKIKESGLSFDAVVDFCGYVPGDIRRIFEKLPCQIRQYIFISTVDVYRRGLKGFKNEETEYETRSILGEAGAYIGGKIALERELEEVCGEKGAAYTILRPGILYGPYNYAPRESIYIQLAVQNGILPEITDASGQFQFTYIKDGAEAVKRCLLEEKAYGQAYNICGNEVVDYGIFLNALEECAKKQTGQKEKEPDDGSKHTAPFNPASSDRLSSPLKRLKMTVKQAEEQGIPLPFPVYQEETELYSNEKSKKELGIFYTPLLQGMEKTYEAFKGVFG